MKIEIVEPSGFCVGVNRAIQLVEEAFERYNAVYCLGELIHNDIVIRELGSKGLKLIERVQNVNLPAKSALVIRTHGITPEDYSYLDKLGINLIDATCPIVKNIQNMCKQFSSQGVRILIFGDGRHEEVKSLLGFSNGKAEVIDEKLDLDKLSLDGNTVLISQSTKEEGKLLKLKEELSKRGLKEENFYNTICCDIRARQKKVESLAGRVDLVLILGSRKSSNTNNLYKIAKGKCTQSYLVSNLDELPKEKIVESKEIGIATGASTPYNFLNAVLEEINKISKRGEGDGAQC